LKTYVILGRSLAAGVTSTRGGRQFPRYGYS
jgi:hypothetical protein